MRDDLTTFGARVAALNAAVAFTAAARHGADRTPATEEVDRAEAWTLTTAGRFERWLNRPDPLEMVERHLTEQLDPIPPLALNQQDG